jgi:hypothetical protein
MSFCWAILGSVTLSSVSLVRGSIIDMREDDEDGNPKFRFKNENFWRLYVRRLSMKPHH